MYPKIQEPILPDFNRARPYSRVFTVLGVLGVFEVSLLALF